MSSSLSTKRVAGFVAHMRDKTMPLLQMITEKNRFVVLAEKQQDHVPSPVKRCTNLLGVWSIEHVFSQ
ncbi:MAG TPA: hypothetical protein VE616_11720 [Candidatus Udaeobacter sp.]|jgi:hypothetical protein|nr:hypothetical protein [Candidatus Udaeobacter sp.]